MEVEPAVDDTTADRGDLLANFEGSPAAVDVSVADALAYLSCQKSSPIGATQLRDRMKLRKYQERYQKRDVSFFPISLQSLGGLGQKALRLMLGLPQTHVLGNRSATCCGSHVDSLAHHALSCGSVYLCFI